MLSGKDVEKFDCAIKVNKTKKVDQSEYERAKSIIERVSKSPSS